MRQKIVNVHCSLARSLQVVGDRWSPLILRDLAFGPLRFEELAEDLGISRNLLTTRLGRLEAAGIVDRVPYQRNPLRHDYELGEAGRQLIPVLMALTVWGDRWTNPEGGPPVLYRHRDCGQVIAPTVACPSCREPVTLDDVDIIGGPGRLLGRGTMLARAFISRRLATTESPLRPRAR